MIYINRESEPSFWREFRKDNFGIQYNELQATEEGKKTRNQLREFNIRQQHGLCAYCCRCISIDKSLNEHIKPEDGYPQLSMDYSNLIACCIPNTADETCGASKKNKYEEDLFVSPLEEDCETHFAYHLNGEVVSITQKGDYTIQLLNLNSYRLRNARKAQIEVCASYHNSELVRTLFLEPDNKNQLQPFADIVKYFYLNGYFEMSGKT